MVDVGCFVQTQTGCQSDPLSPVFSSVTLSHWRHLSPPEKTEHCLGFLDIHDMLGGRRNISKLKINFASKHFRDNQSEIIF